MIYLLYFNILMVEKKIDVKFIKILSLKCQGGAAALYYSITMLTYYIIQT
jgi:hypothetical protein